MHRPPARDTNRASTSFSARSPARRGVRRLQAGFTLIELLLVVAILSILGAIAIQYYQRYRSQAHDARAMHDLGNAAVAEEAYYATTFAYTDFEATGPAALTTPGLVVSATVHIKGEASANSFRVTATSTSGTGKTFLFDSTVGEITTQ